MKLSHLLEQATDKLPYNSSHRERVVRLTQNLQYTEYIESFQERQEWLAKFRDRGYLWAVSERFVQVFRYAASVRSTMPRSSPFYPVRTREGNVSYIGDIPDFALDNIEKAIQDGLRIITIHSTKPLPVEVFKVTDPVLVGWAATPNIYLDYYHQDYRGGAGYKHCFNHADSHWPAPHRYGFVIAIWDDNGNPTELS